MNITLEPKKVLTQEAIQEGIRFHTGEISKLRVQLSDPNQPNKPILNKALTYHQTELNKFLRS